MIRVREYKIKGNKLIAVLSNKKELELPKECYPEIYKKTANYYKQYAI